MTVPLLQRLRNWWREFQQSRADARQIVERQWVVRFDAQGVAVDHPGGEQQSITWDEVRTIAIETNDSGPWGPDVWWQLEGVENFCAFPFGATGEQRAFEIILAQFPGFDSDLFSKAMWTTDNARFVCWERKA